MIIQSVELIKPFSLQDLLKTENSVSSKKVNEYTHQYIKAAIITQMIFNYSHYISGLSLKENLNNYRFK